LIKIKADWKYDPVKKQLTLTVNQLQKQDELYSFPMDIAINVPGNKVPVLKKINIKKQSETFVFPLAKKPETIELDPRKVLLSNIELIKIE
ncbi:MAG: hypothetical protein ABI666_02650, partial [Ferruginibacter sp.]